jgi:ribose 5-phosphate isomerase A
MAAAVVRELANFERRETLACIPTSFQIKMEAERSGLHLVDEDRIPGIDVVFDGADEIDRNFNMIKGGGGALLREKVIHSAAKKIVIVAEATKFVSAFSWPIPIEVHPFALHIVRRRLEEAGGKPNLRILKEGYPYVTENGNFVLDTNFNLESFDPRQKESELKNIAGVVEVGLFTKRASTYYKAKERGSFEMIGAA